MSMYMQPSGYEYPAEEAYYSLQRESHSYWPQQSPYNPPMPRDVHSGHYINPQEVLHDGLYDMSYDTMPAKPGPFRETAMLSPSRHRSNSIVIQQESRPSYYEFSTTEPTKRRRTGSNASQSVMSLSMSPGSADGNYSPIIGNSTKNGNGGRFHCQHPTCIDASGESTRSFSRNADLVRHMKSSHGKVERLDCPRRNCVRKGENGFTRLDHLIEHRRGYHGEDIPKRHRSTGSSAH